MRYLFKKPSLRALFCLAILLFCGLALYLRHHHAIDLVSYEEDPAVLFLLLFLVSAIMVPRPAFWGALLAVVVFTPASAAPWLAGYVLHGGTAALVVCCVLI